MGDIYVEFWCEEMPWLLDERCKIKIDKLPASWDLFHRLQRRIKHKREGRVYRKSVIQRIRNAWDEADISYEVMTKKEILAHKKQWLSAFAPADADMCDLSELCIGSEKFSGYLWHLFSFECVSTTTPEQAQIFFDQTEKREVVVIENWIKEGYRVCDISKITSVFLSHGMM